MGSKPADLVFGLAFVIHQLKALFVKRLIHTLRNKALVIVQILVPIGVLLIDLTYIKYGPVKAEDSPLLRMSLDRYRDNFVPYQKIEYANQTPAQVAQIDEWTRLFALSVNASTNSKAFRLDQNDTVSVCLDRRGSIPFFLSLS